jgi:hypothetical protein
MNIGKSHERNMLFLMCIFYTCFNVHLFKTMLWLIDNVVDYERGNITTVLSAVTFKCSEIFRPQGLMATVQFTFNAVIPEVLSWLIARWILSM